MALEGGLKASGTFTDGPLGMPDGIVMSSGYAEDVTEPDDDCCTTGSNDVAGDPLCNALTPGFTSYDGVRLTLQFTLDASFDGIQFWYVVGSEEYPDFAGGAYNDSVGVFLDGANVALDLQGHPITINGPFFTGDTVIDSPATESEFNGSTPLLTTAATPGHDGVHELIIVVCDAGDRLWDTAVFVSALSGCVGECSGTAYCGDGVLVAGVEQCDDGNNELGDGCDVSCQIEPGWGCTGVDQEQSVCAPTCGNGTVQATEECDDANSNDQDDCTSVCRFATCDDELWHNQGSGTESDVDCGGDVCPPCGDGRDCADGDDCESGVCESGSCQAPTCSDDVKNGDETGVDCGGSCPDCPDGEGCDDPGDCQSGVCLGGICQPPACDDLTRNGDETDVDCGGESCNGCPPGDDCDDGADCLSGSCPAGTCAAPTCSDGLQNQGEAGVDCGGPCPACPTCDDGAQNQGEAGVDCGGPCPACVETCDSDADCGDQQCSAGVCQPWHSCFADADYDGFGGATALPSADADCDDLGESDVDTDCDDTNPWIYPGAPDYPNDGVDSNCDGVDPTDCTLDSDGDGLSDCDETDSDGDGLPDELEGLTGTDPTDPDTDGDCLCDGALAVADCAAGEDLDASGTVDGGETDPRRDDTDHDGLFDGLEVNGDNPTAGYLADTDGDGLCDGPLGVPDVCVPGEDADADGALDPGEFDPAEPDTSGDGICDGASGVLGVCSAAVYPPAPLAPPTVTIDAPIDNTKYNYAPPGVDVAVNVTLAQVTLQECGYHLEYHLDGEPLAGSDDLTSIVVQDLQPGLHRIVARLVGPGGAGRGHAASADEVVIKVQIPCEEDADCDDGYACSSDACIGDVCRFGLDDTCCDNDLDCGPGLVCDAGQCNDCNTLPDCDDGDACTLDVCVGGAVCAAYPDPGCCSHDGQCDDGDFCTIDSCDPETRTCSNVDNGDADCCSVDADCYRGDDCEALHCYNDSDTEKRYCRWGPAPFDCCTTSADCDDGNPCTAEACTEFDHPAFEGAGLCVTEPVPGDSGCCVAASDCDDGDAATLDHCIDSACQHVANPLWCPVPETSSVVISELMSAPGALPDGLGEWIELHNPGDDYIELEGWHLQLGDTQQHTIEEPLTVGPGAYITLARTVVPDLAAGLAADYAYGNHLLLPDPWSGPAGGIVELSLLDAEGQLIDVVSFDAGAWPAVDGCSMELANTHLDNTDPTSWSLAGGFSPTGQPLAPFGDPAFALQGSPGAANITSWRDLPAPGCPMPAGAHPCAVPSCSLHNQCVFPTAEGCCETDGDCDDGFACTTNTCDQESGTCATPEASSACCGSDADCDDGDPCSSDRCIANACRFGPGLDATCCIADDDCDDGDPCTVDACDQEAHTCLAGTQVVPPAGQTCCASAADCDDADPATVDLCDPTNDTCAFPPDPDFCEGAGDCDDGDPCTSDGCDLQANQCTHDAVAGCCDEHHDCDDGDPCTASACDFETGACDQSPIAECCEADADCDDGAPCTTDVCAANQCHHNEVAECCAGAADEAAACDDGDPCTADACVDGACVHDAIAGCCHEGMTNGELIGTCGPDPDGSQLCQAWTCGPDNACVLVDNPDCCAGEPQGPSETCDDSDPCTIDLCMGTGLCKHIATTAAGCSP